MIALVVVVVIVVVVVVEPDKTDYDSRYADNDNDSMAFNLRDP